jgi:hypothetical protein
LKNAAGGLVPHHVVAFHELLVRRFEPSPSGLRIEADQIAIYVHIESPCIVYAISRSIKTRKCQGDPDQRRRVFQSLEKSLIRAGGRFAGQRLAGRHRSAFHRRDQPRDQVGTKGPWGIADPTWLIIRVLLVALRPRRVAGQLSISCLRF